MTHLITQKKKLFTGRGYKIFECNCGAPVLEIYNVFKTDAGFKRVRKEFGKCIMWIVNQDKTYFHIQKTE